MSRGLWFAMSARTRRSLTLLWTALFLCSLAMQYVQLAVPAPVLAVHDEGLFELDGNALDPAGGGDDWAAVYGGTDSADATLFITDSVQERSFTGGGSKDDLNTTQWQHTSQSVPDKDDIQHAFAALYGDFLYYGGDRSQISGDAQMGFWFFKNGISVNANGTFTPAHTVGDLLVLSHFSNGGSASTIELYQWVGSGGDTNDTLDKVATGATCTGSPADDIACAMANAANSNSPWPYTPKSGANNVFGANAFFEGGLDLADLYGGNPPCFSSFLVETRSSTSISSTLQDFASGAFNTCVPPTITTQSSASTVDFGGTVTDTATLSGTDGPASGSVKFYVCSPAQITGAGCPTGGTQVGGAVAVTTSTNGGTATSSAYTVGQTSAAVGTYCWRAEYTPDGASQYLAGSHTNATTECFTVAPATIDIDKVANPAGPVSAGAVIGFDITVTNIGTGTALGVAVNDPLPAGVDWVLGTVTGGASCEITGAVNSEILGCTKASLASGASFTVRVTGTTDAADCGTVNNTGAVSTTNDGTDSDPASVVVQCPDVTVAKTPDGGSVNAGDTATFTIVVTNLGPGAASSVTLTDNLPAGYTWTLGGANAASCSIDTAPSPDVLSCNFDTLADDATRTITLSAPTSGANCATIPNTATVGASNEPASANGNNSDSGDIEVLCAQIDIDKVANPVGPVNAGDEIGFDITVTNNGDGTATGVSVTDNLPAGIVWTADAATGDTTGVSCSINTAPNPDVLTCTDASMAAGDSFTVHIHGRTDAADCRTVNNTANVTTTNDGSDSQAASVVVLCPDLTVLKVADADPINAGDPIGFTITVTNLGPGLAKSVTLTDSLPAGIVWSVNSASCSIDTAPNPDVLTCSFRTLADDATASVRLTGTTTSANCATIVNTATVSGSNEPQSATSNNSSTDSVVVNCPDVTVLKVADADPINAGDPIGFTITVTNLGPGLAKSVTLTDSLPAGIVWSVNSASCSIDTAPNPDVLSCNFSDMASGASAGVHLTGTTDATDCGTIPNTATVGATNEAAAQTGNNSSSDSVVVQCPDLEIVKDGNGPISAGQEAVFTITVTNHGPGLAKAVTLTDTLPTGVAWTEDSASCSIAAGVLTCTFSDMASGATASVTLSGDTDVEDCGTIPNTASVSASNENTANDQYPNSDDATIVVDCPLIVITKTADSAVVNAGDQIGFTVTVTNTGDGSAFGVTVTDTLPAGFTWTESPDAAGWSITGGVLTFGPATLASGASVTVHIVATTDAADCGIVPNTAFLTYTGGSGSDDDSVTVNCPDITVIKSGNGPIVNGQVATFVITTYNEGPGVAYGVTLTDQLPAGVWTLGGADAADCAISASNLLTCAFGTIDAPGNEADSSRTITVSKTATTADCGTIPNLVTVGASNEAAADTGNNADDASITVRCPDVDIDKTADDDFVEPNQVVTYTIDVKVLNGPVTNAVVTDVLPVGQTYVAGSAKSDGIADAPTVSPDGRTLTWTFASLDNGDPTLVITYDVKIDSGATGAAQQNTAEVCVDEDTPCASAVELVTPQFPAIQIIKTAGAAANGAVFQTEAGPVTYTYVVKNTGPLTLINVTVKDDAGTPGVPGDDFLATCPKTTLAPAESMTCTKTVNVAVDTTNIAVARGVTVEGNPVQDDDPATVVILEFGLLIDKTNDAPLESLKLPDGTIVDLPTADEGDTVTYTLDYDLVGDAVTNGIITDKLPIGVTYVNGSASSDAQFTFQSYNAGTRTLTWRAANVATDGTLTYQAKVDVGASELPQPLLNVATIDSAQTEPDDDDSDIFVPTIPLAATATPRVTLPPTDVFGDSNGTSNPGFSLMLILLALGAFVLVVGFVTPVPASVRERERR